MKQEVSTRRKDPERVRQALIDGAAVLVAEHGLANATVAAVAASASVTKGALFHHFADRDALIAAMFDTLLDQLDRQLDGLIADDPVEHGRFTRAYVNTALARDDGNRHIWAALTGTLFGDNALTRRWYQWLGERLAACLADHDPTLEVVRLAADGGWIAATTGISPIDIDALRVRLIEYTRLATQGDDRSR